jgi:hypothetical protein
VFSTPIENFNINTKKETHINHVGLFSHIDTNSSLSYYSVSANTDRKTNTQKEQIMTKNVLYKENEQPIEAELDVNFSFKNGSYRAKITASTVPALASIPCSGCGKTTRKILSELGVSIPTDDLHVNVPEIITGDLPEHSATDPEYVFVITDVFTENIVNTNTMLDVENGCRTERRISAYIKRKLEGHISCNACFFQANGAIAGGILG